MRKKKILFFLSSLKAGGAEKHTVSIINSMDEKRFEIGLCYFEAKDDLIGEIKKRRLALITSCYKKNKFDFKVLFILKKQLHFFNPDIVVCVDPYTGLYANMLRFLKKKRFKIVQIIHQTMPLSIYTDLIAKYLYRPVMNRCDKVLFVCRNQMIYWHKAYQINRKISSYIYNGVDTKHFQPSSVSNQQIKTLKNKFNFDETDFIVGICAVLRSEKKHEDFLNALKKVLLQKKNVKLLIIGDGPQKKKIQETIRKLGLADNVVMAGFQADVRPYLSMCDLIAITSTAVETFSIAILESMAMGKAILASDIGGASEQVINWKTGLLYPAGDIAELTAKLKRLIDKELCKKMGEESRSIVAKKFTVQKMVNSYNELLDSNF